MTNIDEILAAAEDLAHRRTVAAKILLRQDLAAKHAELEARVQREAEQDRLLNREPVAEQLAQELAELEDEIEAAQVTFTFASIGKRAWADLIAKYPPTKEQRAARSDVNTDEFAAPAIAASCIDPVMTIDQVLRLEEALNASQFDLLFAKAVEANIGGTVLPKSTAAGLIRRANVRSAATAASGASPDQSSLDE